jgi:hypothetical protein
VLAELEVLEPRREDAVRGGAIGGVEDGAQ